MNEQLAAVGYVVLWLGLVAGLARLVKHYVPQQPEWGRKLLHVGAGPTVVIAWSLGIERWIALSAAIGITVLIALNRQFRWLQGIEDVSRHSYGTVAYGLAVVVLLWWGWPHRAAVVTAAVLVLAVGDGLAGLLGPAVASPRWHVLGQQKSLLGTSCVGLTAFLVGLWLFGNTLLWPQLLLVAAVAAALEQVSVLGADNLLLPVGVAALLNALLP